MIKLTQIAELQIGDCVEYQHSDHAGKNLQGFIANIYTSQLSGEPIFTIVDYASEVKSFKYYTDAGLIVAWCNITKIIEEN